MLNRRVRTKPILLTHYTSVSRVSHSQLTRK